MGMGVEDPLDLKSVLTDIIENDVGICRSRRTGLFVEIAHRIDNGALARLRVRQHILYAGGALVEEAVDHGTPRHMRGQPYGCRRRVDAMRLSERGDICNCHPAVQGLTDNVKQQCAGARFAMGDDRARRLIHDPLKCPNIGFRDRRNGNGYECVFQMCTLRGIFFGVRSRLRWLLPIRPGID